MDQMTLAMLSVSLLGAISLIGFFITKTEGFGKFNTSTLVLLVVFVLCAVLFSADRVSNELFANIVMAIVGFAGGLVVAREK